MMAIKIQQIMLEKGYKKRELAERCGWSAPNFSQKLKRNNFTEEELLTIADALGLTLKISFEDKGAE